MLAGTDGFRDIATAEPGPGLMNEETVGGLSHALFDFQLDNGRCGPVVVAQDTRESGEALRASATDAALVRGLEVIDLEVAPTPMAQKVAERMGAIATVVITASHNPAEYNGWKGMVGNSKPDKAAQSEIHHRYWSQVESGLVLPRGMHKHAPSQSEHYTAWYRHRVVGDIQRQFGEQQPLDGKIFVVDGAYGAAQHITPEVLRDLGATVEEFACDGSGVINDECGAADLSGLKAYLRARPDLLENPKFVGAIANDGDADRMMGIGVVREKGENRLVEINGNHVMGALAQGEQGIVGTEYTNTALVRRLQEQSIDFEYCDNGDTYVTQALRAKQQANEPWRRGGEFTGHHVDLDWLPSGDGVRMAAWFAAWSVDQGMTFGDVHQELPLWHEKMQKVDFPAATARRAIKQDPHVQEALARVESELAGDGRVVLRPSGTEPVVRIWGEAPEEHRITRVVNHLVEVVRGRAIAVELG